MVQENQGTMKSCVVILFLLLVDSGSVQVKINFSTALTHNLGGTTATESNGLENGLTTPIKWTIVQLS